MRSVLLKEQSHNEINDFRITMLISCTSRTYSALGADTDEWKRKRAWIERKLTRVISKGVPLQAVSGTEMQYFLRSKSHSNRSFYTPIDRKRFKLELCIFSRKKVMTVFLEKHLFRVPAAITFQEDF